MKSAATHSLPGRQPTSVEWVYLRDIYADSRYQRPTDEARVRRYADEFNPDALGLPFVSEHIRGGRPKFAVIDGQHRHAAALLAFGGDQMIECEVIRGLSVEQEAKLFRERNASVKLTALIAFLAGVTSGDEECTAINKIVESVGLKVSVVRGDRIVQGVRALQKVYRGDRGLAGGKNALPLKRTLMVLNDAWGPSVEAYNAELIHGLGLFMTRHGDVVDVDSLVQKLRGYPGGSVRLIGDAKGLRSINGGGMLAHAVADIITKTYNKGRRGKSDLPDWREKE